MVKDIQGIWHNFMLKNISLKGGNMKLYDISLYGQFIDGRYQPFDQRM